MRPWGGDLDTRQVRELGVEAQHAVAFDLAVGPVVHGQGHHIDLTFANPVHIQDGAILGIDAQVLAITFVINLIGSVWFKKMVRFDSRRNSLQ